MKKLLTLLVLATVLPLSGWAKVRSIKIYHVPWDVMTFVDMSADSVRKNASFIYEITDAAYAEKFLSALETEKFADGDRQPVSDLRLVIDVSNADGSVVTIVASRFEVGAQKSGKKRPIDEAFRARFSSLYEKKG